MNLSSRTAAGRSRSADVDAFLRPHVVQPTDSDSSGPSAASPHAWKRVLQERIWSLRGPKGLAARSILMLLVWHADTNGRTWLGIQAIANKTGAGNLRTVRHALDGLVRDGWLRSTPQTWASLTAEQTAMGRPAPRRGDVGQAPNLYILLDGYGHPAASNVQPSTTPMRPGLARAALLSSRSQENPQEQGLFDQGSPGQDDQGRPRADLPHDPDPKGSPSRIERAKRVSRAGRSTHLVSNVRTETEGWLDAWNVVAETHADKTKTVYGLPPLAPDLKREQQQALAECLDGAALDVQAKLRARTQTERDLGDVRRDLATRVMQLYFKRDNEHLRRVKHALRDLPREFHARITEAMQLLLRESHDATKPRQMPLETKIVETNKPTPRPSPASTTEATQVSTAREARRLLEALNAAPLHEDVELATRDVSKDFTTNNERPDKRRADKPVLDKHPNVSRIRLERECSQRFG